MNAVRAVLVKLLSGRAEAGSGVRVVGEVAWPIGLGGFLRVSLVVERVRKGFVFLLIIESFVPLPHAVVGDQGRYVLFGERLQIAFGVVTGVGGD